MIADEIFEEASHLQTMAANYPHPATKAVLLEAAMLLFKHCADARALEPARLEKAGTPEA